MFGKHPDAPGPAGDVRESHYIRSDRTVSFQLEPRMTGRSKAVIPLPGHPRNRTLEGRCPLKLREPVDPGVFREIVDP